MRKALATMMVVLLALSAGCLGFFGGQDTTDTTPTPEVTADTETTETATETETTETETESDTNKGLSAFPNGVTGDGVEEQTVLNGHMSILSGSSATVNYTSTLDDGKYRATQTIQTQYDQNAQLDSVSNDGYTRTMYTTGKDSTPLYIQSSSDSETRYIVDDEAVIPKAQSMQQMRVRALLLGGEYQYQGNATVDGEAVAVLKATEFRDEKAIQPIAFGDAQSINATAYVTADGVVKKIDFDITTSSNDIEMNYNGTLTYSDVGETTVEEPDWFIDAKEKAVTMDVQQQDSLVVAEMNQGETIQSGATVRIFLEDNGRFVTGTLDQAVEPGDTVYVGLTDSGEVAVGVNEKPSGASISQAGDITFTVNDAVAYKDTFGNE